MRPVTIAAIGGLGNQLFQFAAALALAQASGRDIRLCVRMYDQRMLRTAFVRARGWFLSALSDADGRFRLGAMSRTAEITTMQRLARASTMAEDAAAGLTRRSLRRVFRDPSATIEGVHVLRTVTEVVAAAERRSPIAADRLPLIAGYVQGDVLVSTVLDRMRGEITWPDTPYVRKWRRTAECPTTVGVHVRRGDYLRSAFRDLFPLLQAEWYRRAAEVLVARHGALRFLVVTDEPAWAKAHLKLPGPVDLPSAEHPASPQEDLALLASCRHHIIANSTFSWWGARLAGRGGDAGDVVAPTAWHMLGKPLDPGYLPASWILLPNVPSRD